MKIIDVFSAIKTGKQDARVMNVVEDAKMIKALADEHRLAIMRALQAGRKCGNDLLAELAISQPTLSHHMKILTESGLVVCHRDGRSIRYEISRPGALSFQDMTAAYLGLANDAKPQDAPLQEPEEDCDE